jgi:hypothetical protein
MPDLPDEVWAAMEASACIYIREVSRSLKGLEGMKLAEALYKGVMWKLAEEAMEVGGTNTEEMLREMEEERMHTEK